MRPDRSRLSVALVLLLSAPLFACGDDLGAPVESTTDASASSSGGDTGELGDLGGATDNVGEVWLK